MEPNATPTPSAGSTVPKSFVPERTFARSEIPKKYIRTFSGDIQAVQTGGKPDLTPLVEQQPPSAAERIVAPSPIPETNRNQFSPRVPEFSFPVTALPPVVEIPALPLETTVPSPLKTYSGDFSDKVKETKATTATIVAAEQDSAPQGGEEEPRETKNVFAILAGILLLALGGGGAFYSYSHYTTVPIPVMTQQVTAPIFVDDRHEIVGNGNVLLQAIIQSVSSPLALHAVRFLYTASSSEPGADIFSALPISTPDILRRNLNANGSMVGIVNADTTPTPFFILSVATYRDTFAGMLSWESTMPENLAQLYQAYPAPIISTTTLVIATTTPQKNKKSSPHASLITVATTTIARPTYNAGFRDEVVNNHDVRIYRDGFGRSVIVYGYWNPTTLVIARDPAAFAEIISRLATTRTQ